MRKNLVSLLVWLILIQAKVAMGQDTSLDSIDNFILHQAEKFHVPGIAACVIKGDQVVWSKAYGYANIESEKEMTPESVMNIASISKTITATAVLQLWEKGLLKLDEDVHTYVDFEVRNPAFPDIPITIQQLLTHTSSIADGSSLKIGFECGEPTRNLKDWLYNYFDVGGEYFDKTENFHNSQPDSLREYSNIGFGLLGLIVEEVTQTPFHQYVKENIFKPLEMEDSGYFLHEVDADKLATSYLYLGPLQQNLNPSRNAKLPYFNPYCQYSFWNYPDGLVRTSVRDLAKFGIAYMNGGLYRGNRILEEATINLMMTPQLSEEINADRDQGLCWFQSPSLFPTWYHGGSDPGVSTRMYVNKEDKIGVIVFQNVNEDNTFYIVKELFRRFK